MDYFMFAIYISAASLCMLASTSFHLFSGHSQQTYKKCLTIDLSGITGLCTASFVPPLYYFYSCSPFWRTFYLCCIFVFSILGVVGPQWSTFHTARMRPMRLGLYGSMAVFGLFPAIHGFWIIGDQTWIVLEKIFYMYLCYFIGVLFYSTRFPECKWPGKFDLLGSSHQIWHVFVLGGAVAQLNTCWYSYTQFTNRTCEA
eukprot:TRINITY_DN8697_c0_g1_i1.p1 TRINITY_DN8697_c0_g1~~TRINITY_DN8697_c0_g1_i1.p1  ORF type:complete len:200 (-),score=0.28 TRINITY_DN8697_c0_g1_i1:44-643(-)